MTVRGACPTLTAPMLTGDGLLVRLALDHPGLPPKTLAEIASAAVDLGNGLIDISARGNIQIRGLSAISVPAFALRIEALDILGPDVPAIVINPLAGIDPALGSDPLDVARSLRSRIDRTLVLAPKITILIDGGGVFPLDTQTADIRLVAIGGQWLIALAGDAMSATPLAMVDGQNAVPAILRLLSVLASRGSNLRARDILGKEGTAPFSAALQGLECGTPPAADRAVPIRFVGHHTLSDGGAILGIALPFGQANAVTLIRLSQIAEQQGATTLCPAPDHALLITGLPLENVEAMADAAAGLGLVTDPGDARLGIAACSGAPACASGHFDTRVVARALGLRYPELMTHGRRVHISGCSKGCAHPSAADLAIVGRPDGIALVIDGRADGIPATVLPHPQPSALVAEIMQILETTK